MLGCLAGVLLGGSQGLARSLFGQMVPETRSTEFFGFFGFFGKVAAFMGDRTIQAVKTRYELIIKSDRKNTTFLDPEILSKPRKIIQTGLRLV